MCKAVLSRKINSSGFMFFLKVGVMFGFYT